LAVCIIATIWPPELPLQGSFVDAENEAQESWARGRRLAEFSPCSESTEQFWPIRRLL
jgi:hypothetical protein